MKLRRVVFVILLSCTFHIAFSNLLNNVNSKDSLLRSIPSLDELAGNWMPMNTLMNQPSVNNFSGAVKSNNNIAGFTCLTIAPFSQGGQSGEMLIDGHEIKATDSKWYPYQVVRRTNNNSLYIETQMRMPFNQQGLLLRAIFQNNTNKAITQSVSINLFTKIRQYPNEAWKTWGTPRPGDKKITIKTDGRAGVVTSDNLSAATTSVYFVQSPSEIKTDSTNCTATWQLKLQPGQKITIEYAMAIDKDADSSTAHAKAMVKNFAYVFTQAKEKWDATWRSAFVPHNKFFSGYLPTLTTNDARIKRVYYQSALVPLLLCRTTYPFNNKFFATAGPEWANTLEYFWDASMWPTLWALLEPKTMRQQLLNWFNVDVHACYAIDGMSGKGAGPWYAANDWSIFRCAEAYISVTGDVNVLKEQANGKTLLEQLNGLATYFEKIPLHEKTLLANYGGPQNLLECSPTYIEGVPSLNAANVYMLRHMAVYNRWAGKQSLAMQQEEKAKMLLQEVKSLYEPGQGVWSALDKKGNKIPLRHCFDYIMVGESLYEDLEDSVKMQMTKFVEDELLTTTWMRAMSLKDPAAANSDRPDHGPMGSYDGWPPLVAGVMSLFGHFNKSIAFLRAVEPVTHEGPFAQAHEFVGPDNKGNNPIVRIAHRGGQDYNEGCGAAFADVLIRDIFGFEPSLLGDKVTLFKSQSPRGFEGVLSNINCQNKNLKIISSANGVKFKN
jgi:hypothetical protein